MKSSLVILVLICCPAVACYSAETAGSPFEERGDVASVVAMQYPGVGRPDFPETPPPAGVVRGIAEFEPCQGVIVNFVDMKPGLEFEVPVELIAVMSEVVVVTTVVKNQLEEDRAIEIFQASDVNVANCNFIHSPVDRGWYWVRDYGPWFISVDNQLAVVDASFAPSRGLACDDFPIWFAEWMGVDCYGMNLVYDGGNYMTDGMGVAVSTDSVWNENGGSYGIEPDPEMRSAIDQLLEDYLGISTFHVTDDPMLATSSFHIDCSAKFLDVDKILIAQVPPDSRQYEECEAMAEYWANQTSSWGSPYQVFRVEISDRYLPYTNSLILNDHVFVPLMDFEEFAELNEAALAVYEAAMPGYTVLGVPSFYWSDFDALHCRTHEVPDSNMLYIHHMPLWGEAAYQTEYTVTAEIVPFSRQPVAAASVFYRIDGGPYMEIPMEWISGDTYVAAIPEQAPEALVEYYIHGEDESGKAANHPFIGAPDPHQFIVGTMPDSTS